MEESSLFLLDFSFEGVNGIVLMMIAMGIGTAVGFLLLGAVMFSYLLKGE